MEMFSYYLKLSVRNLQRNWLFFSLMTLTLAVGVGVLLANVTILKSMANDPIPQKSSRVFSVNLSTWPNSPSNHEQPMHIMRHSDARHILASDIPTHKMVHYQSWVYTRDINSTSLARVGASVRATTPGFFGLTDAPFAYGGSWTQANAQEVVIGEDLNQQLYHGANSVGNNIEIDGKPFTIVGVLKKWNLKPLFYHATEQQAFNKTDDIFAPIETALTNEWGINARSSSTQSFSSPSDTRGKDVFYIQAFVQLDTKQQQDNFQNYLDSYSQSLKDAGQHPLDINNKLFDVNTWLKRNEVVDQRIVAFALATVLFLTVCVFNASSLLLARYHGAKFETALRRAVGASRREIFYQGTVESLIIGIVCAALAMILGWVFLKLSINVFPHLEDVAQIDGEMLVIGVTIALLTTFISALYPLLRACSIKVLTDLK
ncbi:MAG: ABC transporter permease [Gammaproteobacteria bacterium]|nr:ABC transporter permease [Gammaproteobacteria bacterium]